MDKDAQGPFDAIHFLKGGLAGGICCDVTHGALCPIDVVTTHIQLELQVYNRGMIAGFGQVVEVSVRRLLGTTFALRLLPLSFATQEWLRVGLRYHVRRYTQF